MPRLWIDYVIYKILVIFLMAQEGERTYPGVTSAATQTLPIIAGINMAFMAGLFSAVGASDFAYLDKSITVFPFSYLSSWSVEILGRRAYVYITTMLVAVVLYNSLKNSILCQMFNVSEKELWNDKEKVNLEKWQQNAHGHANKAIKYFNIGFAITPLPLLAFISAYAVTPVIVIWACLIGFLIYRQYIRGYSS